MKGKGIVISALLVGAASILSKKENRDKAMQFLSSMKSQATSSLGAIQNKEGFDLKGTTFKDIAETAADSETHRINENEFIEEGGGQTMLAYYNETNQTSVNQSSVN